MTDDNEWGNLLDSESLSRSNIKIAWTEKRRKQLSELSKDPKWLKATTRASRRKAKDPKWLDAVAKGRAELFNDPERYASYTQSLSDSWTEERRAEHLNQIERQAAAGLYKKDQEQKIKLAQAKMRSDIMTPYGVYKSYAEFRLDYPKNKIRDNFNLLPHLYYYVEDGPGPELTQKVYYTPWGCDMKLKDMFAVAKTEDPQNATNKDAKDWFKKMCRRQPTEYYSKIEVKRDWNL